MKKLILVSFVILFLELLLIRLVGTEIRIFAYLSNLILLAIFVGSGLGIFIKRKLSILISSLLLLILTLILTTGIFTNISDLISPLSESFIWFQQGWHSFFSVALGLSLTTMLFLLILAIFIPLGQYLSNYFNDPKRTIFYYSINVFFSLIGIWVFNAFSFLNFSPYVGLVVVQIIFLFLFEKKELNIALFINTFLVSAILIYLLLNQNTTWSPYQKLNLTSLPKNSTQANGYLLKVNNVGYMGLLDLSSGYRQSLETKLKETKLPDDFDFRFTNQYDLPFLINPGAEEVLIIGAGGGNDAAGALRAKTKSIDAVEIDPQIIAFGKKYHPENPYSQENVRIFIDDGRSFLKRTAKKYDLIIMGLADSHTLNSSFNNIQLDNYLYTKEAMEEVKNHLTPRGAFFISFDVRRPWIGEKIQTNLSLVFGHAPLVFNMQNDPPIFGWGGVIFVQDLQEGKISNNLSTNSDLKKFIDNRKVNYGKPVKEITDNWPYLYLDKPRLPKLHLIISLSLIIIFLSLFKKISWTGQFNWKSFFLGAGFLLFEFQNISKTALLYGNTWITNVITISMILVFILLANIMTAKFKIPVKILYLLLFLSFALEVILPLDWFNNLPVFSKYFFSAAILNLPLFFSSSIFIRFFSQAKQQKSFLGSNLIGSSAGGILGFLSYLYGIKFLLYVSGAMYLFSLLIKKDFVKN